MLNSCPELVRVIPGVPQKIVFAGHEKDENASFTVEEFVEALRNPAACAATETRLVQLLEKDQNLRTIVDIFWSIKGLSQRELFSCLQKSYANGYGPNGDLAIVSYHDGRPTMAQFANAPTAIALFFQMFANVGPPRVVWDTYITGRLLGARAEIRGNQGLTLEQTANSQLFAQIFQRAVFRDRTLTLTDCNLYPDDAYECIVHFLKNNSELLMKFTCEVIAAHVRRIGTMHEACLRSILRYGMRHVLYSGTVGAKYAWAAQLQQGFPEDQITGYLTGFLTTSERVSSFCAPDSLEFTELLQISSFPQDQCGALLDVANHGREMADKRARERGLHLDPGHAHALEIYNAFGGKKYIIFEQENGMRCCICPPNGTLKVDLQGSGQEMFDRNGFSAANTFSIYTRNMCLGMDLPMQEECCAIAIVDPNETEMAELLQMAARQRQLFDGKQKLAMFVPRRLTQKLSDSRPDYSPGNPIEKAIILKTAANLTEQLTKKRGYQEMRSTENHLFSDVLMRIIVEKFGEPNADPAGLAAIIPLISRFGAFFTTAIPGDPDMYAGTLETTTAHEAIISKIDRLCAYVAGMVEEEQGLGDQAKCDPEILQELHEQLLLEKETMNTALQDDFFSSSNDYPVRSGIDSGVAVEVARRVDANVQINTEQEQENEYKRQLGLINTIPSGPRIAFSARNLDNSTTAFRLYREGKGTFGKRYGLGESNSASFKEAVGSIAQWTVYPDSTSSMQAKLQNFAELARDNIRLAATLAIQTQNCIPIVHKSFIAPNSVLIYETEDIPTSYEVVLLDEDHARWAERQMYAGKLTKCWFFSAVGDYVRCSPEDSVLPAGAVPVLNRAKLLIAMWQGNMETPLPMGETYASAISEMGGCLSVFTDFGKICGLAAGNRKAMAVYATDSVLSTGFYWSPDFLSAVKKVAPDVDCLRLQAGGNDAIRECLKLAQKTEALKLIPYDHVLLVILLTATNRGVSIEGAMGCPEIEGRVLGFLGRASTNASYSLKTFVRSRYFHFTEKYEQEAPVNPEPGRASIGQRVNVFNKVSASVFLQFGFGEAAMRQLFAQDTLDVDRVNEIIALQASMRKLFFQSAPLSILKKVSSDMLMDFLAEKDVDENRRTEVIRHIFLSDIDMDIFFTREHCWEKFVSFLSSSDDDQCLQRLSVMALKKMLASGLRCPVKIFERLKHVCPDKIDELLNSLDAETILSVLPDSIKDLFADNLAKKGIFSLDEYMQRIRGDIRWEHNPLKFLESFRGDHVTENEIRVLQWCMEHCTEHNMTIPKHLLLVIAKVADGSLQFMDTAGVFAFWDRYGGWLQTTMNDDAKSEFKKLCRENV
ncbi:MAG: hypothetical protein LBC42_01770, partial [Puniceicoccales bacterium]|nr:hypothetical protein [Puniceicoccales bacterium]